MGVKSGPSHQPAYLFPGTVSPVSSRVVTGVTCSGNTEAQRRQPRSSAAAEKSADQSLLVLVFGTRIVRTRPHWRSLKDVLVLPVGSVDRPWGPGTLAIVHKHHVCVGADTGEKVCRHHSVRGMTPQGGTHASRLPGLTQTTEAKSGHQIASPAMLHWLDYALARCSP